MKDRAQPGRCMTGNGLFFTVIGPANGTAGKASLKASGSAFCVRKTVSGLSETLFIIAAAVTAAKKKDSDKKADRFP